MCSSRFKMGKLRLKMIICGNSPFCGKRVGDPGLFGLRNLRPWVMSLTLSSGLEKHHSPWKAAETFPQSTQCPLGRASCTHQECKQQMQFVYNEWFFGQSARTIIIFLQITHESDPVFAMVRSLYSSKLNHSPHGNKQTHLLGCTWFS